MKLIVLDRDGTINVDSDQFIKSPGEWKPIRGSLEGIARLTQADWRVVVATHQSGPACRLFGSRMALERPFGRCACGGTDLEWLAGDELRIKTMEVA